MTPGQLASQLAGGPPKFVADAVVMTKIVADLADQLVTDIVERHRAAHVFQKCIGHVAIKSPAGSSCFDILTDLHGFLPLALRRREVVLGLRGSILHRFSGPRNTSCARQGARPTTRRTRCTEKGDLGSLPITRWTPDDGRPLIIAGPCSAESEEQLAETVRRLPAHRVSYFRAGIWKARTRPNSFEGIGDPALAWLRRAGTARDENGDGSRSRQPRGRGAQDRHRSLLDRRAYHGEPIFGPGNRQRRPGHGRTGAHEESDQPRPGALDRRDRARFCRGRPEARGHPSRFGTARRRATGTRRCGNW